MDYFTLEQWDTLRNNYQKWWGETLGRPILPLIFWGRDPKRDMPKNPLLSFENSDDFSITPQQIIDRYDYHLSTCFYEGDSYPIVNMTPFGPGLAAAFMGCEYHSTPYTIWFETKKILPIEELHFEYRPDCFWFRRIRDIYEAGMEKWQGSVIMGMIDLGGVLDILATFRTSENLLTDLYDNPEEVLRCVKEIQAIWLHFYDDINRLLETGKTQGYTNWAGNYSETPNYMLQSDFSYMISPTMFDTFVAPELDTTAQHMTNAFYHLDGIGEIPHLDTLLSLDSIKGIQWVPGDGEPMRRDWTELFTKVGKAGKKIMTIGGLDIYFKDVLQVLPKPDQLIKMPLYYPISAKPDIEKIVSSLGMML